MDADLHGQRSRARGRHALARLAMAFAGLSMVAGGLALHPGTAGADVPHSGCAAVYAGGSSGWCGLYPGNAVNNVQELGQVTVSPDGTTLTVDTESASTGVVPNSSFACLVSTDPTQIKQRLQDTQCAKAGGVFFPSSGGVITINLTQYPQFLNAQFTVQVAANGSANNSNGDAFYNNVSTSTDVVTAD